MMLSDKIYYDEKSSARVNGFLSLVGGSRWTAEGKWGEDNLDPPTDDKHQPKIHAQGKEQMQR